MVAKANKHYIIWLSVTLLSGALFIGVAIAVLFMPTSTPRENAHINAISRGLHLLSLGKIFMDEKPEHILILFQNENELRPTGGFITAIGSAEIINGTLRDLKIKASNQIIIPFGKSVPLYSEMSGYILTDKLEIRDANWDVDFPTSAATIEKLFGSQSDTAYDVIIAMTSRANEIILSKTGPVVFSINGHNINLNENNATKELERLTDLDFAQLGLNESDRKLVLAEYAQVLLPKLQNLATGNPAESMRLFTQLTNNHDLQIWSPDPLIQKHLAVLGLAKEIVRLNSQDGILLVDSNLGSRKTDAWIKQNVKYQVSRTNNVSRASLTINYENTAKETSLTTDYHDYLRIYLPEGSEMISQSGLTNFKLMNRHGRTVFAGMLKVPIGEYRSVKINYRLPSSVDLMNYQLLIEKQPGGRDLPFDIELATTRGKAIKHSIITKDSLIDL